jgi:hypothetical protein
MYVVVSTSKFGGEAKATLCESVTLDPVNGGWITCVGVQHEPNFHNRSMPIDLVKGVYPVGRNE